MRPLYHAGAAIASNYLVTLYRVGLALLEAAGAPPAALSPSMRRTIDNGFELTGPISRGDTSTERLPELKNVPTTAELGMPEINYTMWHGLYVAKGTPKEIVAVINEALRKAVADPEVVTKLKQLGSLPFPDKEMSPEAHAKLFTADLPRVAKLVESSGAKPSEAQ